MLYIRRAVERSRSDPSAFARELFAGLPERYDLLEKLLSFGQNRRWRTAIVEAVAAGRPEQVLDVATGTVGVARMLADSTGARVTGVDLTEQVLRRGRQRVAGRCGWSPAAPSSCRSPTPDSTR